VQEPESNERGEIVWTPDPAAVASSQMTMFGRFCSERTGRDLSSFPALLDWSIAEPDAFWATFADWAGIHWHDRPAAALTERTMPGARWFPGGTLNYSEHALAGEGDAVAVVSLSQTRARTSLTYEELHEQVRRCAAGLRRLGVEPGDRVVALMPNITETIVAFLAAASIGAVWSSCAPEFGTSAILDRWRQLEPEVLLTIDGYRYGARPISCADKIDAIVADLPSIRHVVTVPYLDELPATIAHRSIVGWGDVCSAWAAGGDPLTFATVPFGHPLYVLFSSGTTGLPKAIVHSHGAMVVEHLKALRLHHDMTADDVFLWFTTTGWMMWNYLVSGLLTGAGIVLVDGDPGFPDLDHLWSIADAERVTVFGVGAPFLMGCRAAGVEPARDFALEHLRQIGSTGSPLPADGFRWVRDHVGARVQLCSISGGTDVCTAFLGAAPAVAVRAGEISTRMLGCDVRAFDEFGNECRPGETGELVICTPMPSMPTGFWGDDSGERFRAAYFEQFDGVWHHGDWIRFENDGGCVITGRSDATLNRGGVRLGTAEFYSVVESLPEIADSVVVHLEKADDPNGELLLFVVLSDGLELDDVLRKRINGELRGALSPRHVPDEIHQVRAVPRTLSAKKLEVPVKRILTGTPVESAAAKGALANPESLTAFEELAQRRSR
jgi:acetoacetyl-CoA synthetase